MNKIENVHILNNNIKSFKVIFFCYILYLLFINQISFAQPYPPINLTIFSETNRNRLTWSHNPLNPSNSIIRYRIYRGTVFGNEVEIANVSGTTISYNDNSAIYNTPYIYYIVSENNLGVISSASERVHRVVPRFGRTIATPVYWPLRNYIWAVAEIPQTEVNLLYFALGNAPGNSTTFAGWSGNINLDLPIFHERSFSTAISSGTVVYLNTLIARPDWQSSNPNNFFYTSYSGSIPVIFAQETFSDISSSTFFLNGQFNCMVDYLNYGIKAKNFSGSGGGIWRIRRIYSVTERNQASRIRAPVRIHVTGIPSGELAAGRTIAEVRVADDMGNELPCYISSETVSGGWVTSFAVHFVTNQNRNTTRNYFIYWNNSSAQTPSYSWNFGCQRLSQWEVSPWYSRRVFRSNPTFTDPSTSRLVASPPSPADDIVVSTTLPWTIPFYDISTNTLFVSTNGYASVMNSNIVTNNWSLFVGPNNHFGVLLAPLWLNLSVNDIYPTSRTSGLYATTSGEWRIFTWIGNRYNGKFEDYIFQLYIYRYGDIQFRYENLNYRGLWVVPSNSNDNPVNVSPHHTVGISRCNGVDYIVSTNNTARYENAPLFEGLNTNYNHYFQSCHSWNVSLVSDPTNIVSTTGTTTVAHYDSRIIDSGSNSPTWGMVNYDVTSNGGSVDIYVRTSNSITSWPAWSLAHRIATDAVSPGSRTLSHLSGQYLQYRVVFKKPNSSADPILNSIRFTVGYITLASVTCEVNGQTIPQGRSFIATMTVINNYSNPVNIIQASPTLSITTASFTFQLLSNLPQNLAPGGVANIRFLISIATDSAVDITPTLNGIVRATDGSVVLEDNSADQTSNFIIRRRPTFTIENVRSPFIKVNKGQGGIFVTAQIRNMSNTLAAVFDGASLTFNLGNYNFNLVSPAINTVINSNAVFTATFSVTVLPTSNSGVDYINATAKCRTQIYPQQEFEATTSQVLHSWIIQEPARLAINKIIVPSKVYRGQTNFPIDVEVANIGEADALLTSCQLNFSLGSFTNLIPQDTFPIRILGGQVRTVRILASLEEGSPVGMCIVDAQVTGYDGNSGFPLSDIGAVSPGQIEILSEKIGIYRDSACLIPADIFSRPTSGVVNAYILVENLAPYKSYRLKFYDPYNNLLPNGDLVRISDENGQIQAHIGINNSFPYGRYNIQLRNIFDFLKLSETSFLLVNPASLTANIILPAKVSVGQTFPVVMNVSNIGGAPAVAVTPSSLQKLGTGNANQVSGPFPAATIINGESFASFTWNYQAVSSGTFMLRGFASGFDETIDMHVLAATTTSNILTIQTPASVTILYITASPTIVYRNQRNIPVDMEIYNDGEAAAQIWTASLTFTPGFGTFRLASPTTLPYILNGKSRLTIKFSVDINSAATTGIATITGRVDFRDDNNPTTLIVRTGGRYNWLIATASIICARDSNFANQQYDFNVGQVIYARAQSLIPNTKVNIKFYPNLDPPTGGGVGALPDLRVSSDGTVSHYYTIPANSPFINTWRVLVDDDLDNDPNTLGNILAEQFVEVYVPPSWTARFEIGSNTCFINDYVRISYVVTNTALARSRGDVTGTNFNFSYFPGSVGSFSYVSVIQPTAYPVVIPSSSSYSFSNLYVAVRDSGFNASTTLNQTSIAVTVRDLNLGVSTNITNLRSNPCIIYRKAFTLASSVIDFGNVAPASKSSLLISRINNVGNHALERIYFNTYELRTNDMKSLPGTSVLFSPNQPFYIATSSFVLARFELDVPPYQSPGHYIATMTIYEDHNNNRSLDISDPHVQFLVRVNVIEACVIFLYPKIINLGILEPGKTTATYTIEVALAGNKNAQNLKFLPVNNSNYTVNFEPIIIGSKPYNAEFSANLSLTLSSNISSGNYNQIITLYDDINGNNILDGDEPHETMKLEWVVGNPSFILIPNKLYLGETDVMKVLSSNQAKMYNNGSLIISNISTYTSNPYNIEHNYTINSENVYLSYPTLLLPGQYYDLNCQVYTPFGSKSGTYFATFTWFIDSNKNNIMDQNEYSRSMLASYVVNSVYMLAPERSVYWLGAGSRGSLVVNRISIINVGTEDINLIKFRVTNLQNADKIIDKNNVSLEPNLISLVPVGSIASTSVQVFIPWDIPDGKYTGKIVAYGDLNNDDELEINEPSCEVEIEVDVGNQNLQITSPSNVSLNGLPDEYTSNVYISIKNVGSLPLNRVKIVSTNLLKSATEQISRENAEFLPSFVVGNLRLNQTKIVQLRYRIPFGQTPGVYNGYLIAFEDSNNNNIVDATEVKDQIPITINVQSYKKLRVQPNNIDLGIAARGDVISNNFLVQNIGNANLLDVRYSLFPLYFGTNIISVSNIQITPSPVGYISAPPPNVPNNVVSTITLSIPTNIPDGYYTGEQIVYEDDYETHLNTYNPGLEPAASFTVSIYVTTPLFNVNPSSINFGDVSPPSTTASVSISIINTGLIGLKNIRWNVVAPLSNGTFTIPSNAIYSYPNIISNLNTNSSSMFEFSVNVSTPTTRIGSYTGTIRFFEDRNNNGIFDLGETYQIVNVILNVQPVYNFAISPLPIKVARGGISNWVSFELENKGNVEIINISFNKNSLVHLIDPNSYIPISSFSISYDYPLPLQPGERGYIKWMVGPTSGNIKIGTYTSSQVFTVNNSYSKSFDLYCYVEEGAYGLGNATIFQNIATSTFLNNNTRRFLLSAFVSPATGSAEIGFLLADDNGKQIASVSVSINSFGIVNTYNSDNISIISSGYTDSFSSEMHNGQILNWYRLYVCFEFEYNQDLASRTAIFLRNTSPNNASYSVMFDGIQFEKAIMDNQVRPTSYNNYLKVISPNNDLDVSGRKYIYEY